MATPAFLSMFDKPTTTPPKSIRKSIRNTIRNTISSNSNTRLIKTTTKKTKKVNDCKDCNYSKDCKDNNLTDLLNYMKFWELKNEIVSLEIPKKPFPEIYHGQFTESIINDSKQIDYNIFNPGNVIQMWKILTKRGQNSHVSCVIWHKNVPHSFSFVPKNESNLSLLSPCNLLEVALVRQKAHNSSLKTKGDHYCELLAIGKLDKTMVQKCKYFMGIIETPIKNKFLAIERAFDYENYEYTKEQIQNFYETNIKDEIKNKQKEVETLFKSRGIPIRRNNNTNLKTLASKKTKLTELLEKKFKYGSTTEPPIVPLVINIPNSYEILIKNKEYCRYNTSRKSKKKNCMGSLDTIFKDIFSCRFKGTIIIPSMCRPKKACITRNPDETNV
jgi:hypothetical protein